MIPMRIVNKILQTTQPYLYAKADSHSTHGMASAYEMALEVRLMATTHVVIYFNNEQGHLILRSH